MRTMLGMLAIAACQNTHRGLAQLRLYLAAAPTSFQRQSARILGPVAARSISRPIGNSCRSSMAPFKMLILAAPDTPELDVLKNLPEGATVLGTGRTEEDFKGLTQEDWASVEVLLNCGVGPQAGKREHVMALWPRLSNLKWLHSASAGLEHLLFCELVTSQVVVTNAKGVYSHSLAEFALTACNWFAKDLPRMRVQQAARKWEPYFVEELRGTTMGIVGYGAIGAECARLAQAFGMRVVALRRRTTLSDAEAKEGILDALYPPEELARLMGESDYVVAALPHTRHTDKFVGAQAFAAMKPNGVFVNIGRGKTVDEPALVEVLQQGKIKGAGLDVFATEPLPDDSPLWDLDNVLMAPHCADRTLKFQLESLELFVELAKKYIAGEELHNVVDKMSGY